MQVIAGSARRIQLKTLPGDHTRPTSNQIKETLFNILQPVVQGSRFLDLFAGSGGIAIEALSRGARDAVLVDNSRQACAVIRDNLERTHLADRAVLLQTDAAAAIKRLSAKGAPFDIIFLDPPYDAGLEMTVLPLLAASPLVTRDSLIILETRAEREIPELEDWGLAVRREKIYKNNKHMFLERKEVTP
ncbi:MAG: 16S rRNA (guanine(966)-N(2))-methyltransferase RsmD [Lachnospiraceae bacterium]|nr:16S rRNA (guanine(966)-N(2))-methyltransferase RsmD [Lachnospiraceae bacterium]